MRRIVLLTLAAILLAAAPARAKVACFSPVEREAALGLRLHSELMVIALTCGRELGGGAMGRYRAFTSGHSALLGEYEARIFDFHRAAGVANPEAAFDAERTAWGNEVSQSAVREGNDGFCRRRASRFEETLRKSDADLRAMLRQAATRFRPGACGSGK